MRKTKYPKSIQNKRLKLKKIIYLKRKIKDGFASLKLSIRNNIVS